MPLIIQRIETPERRGRGGHFDRAVRRLAPAINRFRSEGIEGICRLRDRLNAEGYLAPNGRPEFTYGAMNRILHRMRALRLGPGPRTLSTVASQPRGPHKSGKARCVRRWTPIEIHRDALS